MCNDRLHIQHSGILAQSQMFGNEPALILNYNIFYMILFQMTHKIP